METGPICSHRDRPDSRLPTAESSRQTRTALASKLGNVIRYNGRWEKRLILHNRPVFCLRGDAPVARKCRPAGVTRGTPTVCTQAIEWSVLISVRIIHGCDDYSGGRCAVTAKGFMGADGAAPSTLIAALPRWETSGLGLGSTGKFRITPAPPSGTPAHGTVSATDSGSSSSHVRFRDDSKPFSASCTPLAPSRSVQRKGSSFATCLRKSSHWVLNALS